MKEQGSGYQSNVIQPRFTDRSWWSGEIQQRSWGVLKAGGILVSLLAPPSREDAAKYGVRVGFLGAQPTTGLLKELTHLLDTGQIKPHVGKVFPLEQAQQAQQLKRDGHIPGKIVLKIAN